LTEVHGRRDNIYVVKRLDESLDFRILKPRVAEHSGNGRIKLTGHVKQNRGVFAAGERHAYIAVVVLIPFDDTGLRDLDFSI
jgi:hypothetical protein